MAVEPAAENTPQGQLRPESGKFQDRTFMGGFKLSTRSTLFILMAVAVLIGGGFGLTYADKQLAQVDSGLAQSVDLNTFVATIERDIWRIRAEQPKYSQRPNDALNAAIQEHLALTSTIGQRLDDLYKRPDAAPITEHISTLREAVALYGEQYQQSMQEETAPGPDLTGLEANMRRAILDIGKILTSVKSLSINETMIAIRAASTAFVESGAARDLSVIEDQQKEFSRLLSSIPMPEETNTALAQGMDNYKTALSAYAVVRLALNNTGDRLAEIISYMTPSIDAISGFAGDNYDQVQRQRRFVIQRYRTLIATGVAGAIIVLLLFGLVMLRSISSPIRSAAKAARNLKAGHTDIAVRGLGNNDEIGDIARTLWALRGNLNQASKLSKSMEKARAEAERGRAASAETEWLRRDLQSMKAEADKGKDALAEVVLLRKIIDATADTIGKKQNIDDAQTAPAAPEGHDEALSIDSISSISRQVALSSQNVTAAADEAERTGTLIRNLSDAAVKVEAVESLIAAIGQQADMLIVNTPEQSPNTNLVVLKGEPRSEGVESPDAIAGRFDAIRSAASQANWAVRDIGGLIMGSKEVALDIARLSSTEALEVTTDLLEQSENLRGMLDKLVNKMQSQISESTLKQATDAPNAPNAPNVMDDLLS